MTPELVIILYVVLVSPVGICACGVALGVAHQNVLVIVPAVEVLRGRVDAAGTTIDAPGNGALALVGCRFDAGGASAPSVGVMFFIAVVYVVLVWRMRVGELFLEV